MSFLDPALSAAMPEGGRLRRTRLDPRRVAQALVLLVVLAQLGDVLTTNHVLAAHVDAHEVNPAARLAMIYLGKAWWLPKAALAMFSAYTAVTLRSSSRCLVGVAAAIFGLYALVLLNNLFNL
jgi:hypothetical protein